MSGTQVVTGNNDNYTIGGVRIFFKEEVTPGVYSELYDLGNIVEASIASEVDRLEHFTAKTGSRVKDREVVRETKFSINFTFDEPNADNLNLLFMADGLSDVAAYTTAVTNEVHVLNDERPTYLNRLASTLVGLVVTNTAGTVTYVLNTDYTLVQNGLMVAVARIAAGAITDGQTVHVDYTPNEPAFKSLEPLSQTDRSGIANVQFVSDTGNEFIWKIPQASMSPNGEFTYNDQDWSSFPMTLAIESDGSSAPYGVVYAAGVGANL